MTPQELKNSILQLAIQGKLVEQRAEEGTGRELLEKILAAKNAKDAEKWKGKGRLTRRRGDRGDAPTSAPSPLPGHPLRGQPSAGGYSSPRDEIPDDEKPFDIPDSWEWVRLGELVFNHGQKKPTDDFSYIDIGSIDNRRQKLSSSETIIHPQDASPRARKIVFKGDVLYATVRPYLHNICIIDREFSCEPIASTGFAVMACTPCLDNKFLFYFLLSPDFDRYANSSENAKGVAYPAISDKRLYGALIPLPPLAEQKRIVAKIEELLPLIDRYEKAWSRLESFNKSFPVDMQKSILQMAIQGKLVEQRSEEGTGRELLEKILAAKNAKDAEKGKGKGRLTRRRGDRGDAPTSAPSPLPGHPLRGQPSAGGYSSPRDEIPDDEKPFDIPDSWEWVRLGELVFNHGQKKPTDDFSYIDIGSIDNRRQKLSSSETIIHPQDASPRARKIVFKGDVLYATVRPYLHNICIIDREFSCEPIASTGFAVMACTPCLDNKFLFYFLLSPDFDRYANSSENAKGVAYPAISDKRLYGALIPLPPLAEQKRIVAKIEELLPLCDRLK